MDQPGFVHGFRNQPLSSGPAEFLAVPPLDRRARTGERHDERTYQRVHRLHDRPMVDAPNHAVEVYPPHVVKRRTVTSGSMAAEIVQATMHEKIEFRFRAPLHLLAVCDQGMRSDGDTFVEGLPRSRLRDVRRKLTFVPAGHEYHEWQEPRVLARHVFLFRSCQNADRS